MFDFLRLHWFDVGTFLAFLTAFFVFFTHPSGISFVLWLSFLTLFIHQFEEYRYPGYFPGVINSFMFNSPTPDRFPFNTNSAFIVNTIVGWLFFFLAAVFYSSFIWLGIATILVSVGNIFAHSFLFNIKGKTFYNPGMLTSLVLFLPVCSYFFFFTFSHNLASSFDWILGIVLGIILNFVGILGLIIWLKDDNTTFIFPQRCLVPSMRG